MDVDPDFELLLECSGCRSQKQFPMSDIDAARREDEMLVVCVGFQCSERSLSVVGTDLLPEELSDIDLETAIGLYRSIDAWHPCDAEAVAIFYRWLNDVSSYSWKAVVAAAEFFRTASYGVYAHQGQYAEQYFRDTVSGVDWDESPFCHIDWDLVGDGLLSDHSWMEHPVAGIVVFHE